MFAMQDFLQPDLATYVISGVDRGWYFFAGRTDTGQIVVKSDIVTTCQGLIRHFWYPLFEAPCGTGPQLRSSPTSQNLHVHPRH